MRSRDMVDSLRLQAFLAKLDPEERVLAIHRILDGVAFTLMDDGKSQMDYRYKDTWHWRYRYTGPTGAEIRAIGENFKK
jgi:hypothetical protein